MEIRRGGAEDIPAILALVDAAVAWLVDDIGEVRIAYQVGVVDQWTGVPGTPSEGKGMREALLLGAENAADPAHHSVLTGKARPGTVLRIRKDFQTETSEQCVYAQGYLNSSGGGTPLDCPARGEKAAFDDKLESSMTVPSNGRFHWDVLPSTRPFVGAHVDIYAIKRLARTFRVSPQAMTYRLINRSHE